MRERNKDMSVAFTDLEKAYDNVHRDAMWKLSRISDVGEKLWEVVKSLLQESKVLVERGVWF